MPADWTAEFIRTLREGNVDPALVADSLKEIEAHVIDTGEYVRAAFGDARPYTLSLGLPRRRPPFVRVVATPLLAVCWLVWCTVMLPIDEPGQLTLGVALGALIMAAVGPVSNAVGARHPERSGTWSLAIFGPAMAALMVCLFVFEEVVLTAPRWAWLTALAAAATAAVTASAVDRRRSALVDPVTGRVMRPGWPAYLGWQAREFVDALRSVRDQFGRGPRPR